MSLLLIRILQELQSLLRALGCLKLFVKILSQVCQCGRLFTGSLRLLGKLWTDFALSGGLSRLEITDESFIAVVVLHDILRKLSQSCHYNCLRWLELCARGSLNSLHVALLGFDRLLGRLLCDGPSQTVLLGVSLILLYANLIVSHLLEVLLLLLLGSSHIVVGLPHHDWSAMVSTGGARCILVNSSHSCAIGLRVLLEFEQGVLVRHLNVGRVCLFGVGIWLVGCASDTNISFSADRNRVVLLCQSTLNESFLLSKLRSWFLASVDRSEILAGSPIVDHLVTASDLLALFLAMWSSRLLGRWCPCVSSTGKIVDLQLINDIWHIFI